MPEAAQTGISALDGSIITPVGKRTVFIGGFPAAVMNDQVVNPGVYIGGGINQGSSSVIIDGQPAAFATCVISKATNESTGSAVPAVVQMPAKPGNVLIGP